ncbi:MAG: shikimate dehydrogenase, partial [Acidimicrobiales bacterium]
MTPAATTRTAAVIGNPVRHSLSPIIHNAAFQVLDLDWTYVAFDIAPGCAADALEAMKTLRLGGLSVTMPHKADVANALDQLTPQAALLGAVNCVAWDQGELVGHNTDGAGFVDNLVTETGITLGGKTCAVVGAGGAARAIVLALAEAGAAKVVVINRTKSKAVAAAELARDAGYAGSPEDAASADIIVNATPIGMAGTASAGSVPIPVELLHDDQIVAELVYHPAQTPLLVAAAEAGATPVGGIGMLVHQAAHQFSLWTGVPAPV